MSADGLAESEPGRKPTLVYPFEGPPERAAAASKWRPGSIGCACRCHIR
jgi:hypothetical protein